MASAQAGTKPPGPSGMIATLAILTVLGAGGGGLVGKLVGARLQAQPAVPAAPASQPTSSYSGPTEVRELAPIVVDLAGDQAPRMRLQVAIVYAKTAVENPSLLAAQVGEDIIAFVKTLSLAEIQGASGLVNLREDLNERAAVRSQGAVREVIIETLVTQ